MKHIPKKLSGFALKYIAMVSMLCDHANMLVIRRGFFAPFRGEDGSTLILQNAPAWLGAVQGVYRVFDVLGHLAFPLYVFLLAEGFTHTRDRKRYFLTLLAFALVSEPVFNLAHYEQWTGSPRFKTYSLRSRSPAWNYSCSHALSPTRQSAGSG